MSSGLVNVPLSPVVVMPPMCSDACPVPPVSVKVAVMGEAYGSAPMIVWPYASVALTGMVTVEPAATTNVLATVSAVITPPNVTEIVFD